MATIGTFKKDGAGFTGTIQTLTLKAKVTFEILEADKRPVSAVADNVEVRDVIQVDVAEDRSIDLTLLFDAGHSLEERVLAEQFTA